MRKWTLALVCVLAGLGWSDVIHAAVARFGRWTTFVHQTGGNAPLSIRRESISFSIVNQVLVLLFFG